MTTYNSHDMMLASAKVSPPVAVSASSAAGWLEQLTTYGQAVVVALTIIYTVLQIYFLLRDKFKKKAPKAD